jgi:hypothetical protein
MKRDPNRGRVEFQDSDGTTYYLRLGTNEYCSIESELVKSRGFQYSRLLFRTALINGDPSQKDLTLEDAGALMDELGPTRTGQLMDTTTFSKNLTAAKETEEKSAA